MLSKYLQKQKIVYGKYLVFTAYQLLVITYKQILMMKQNLDMIKDRSSHSFDTNVASTDNILTLLTCYNNSDKMVIHAKLIKKENK